MEAQVDVRWLRRRGFQQVLHNAVWKVAGQDRRVANAGPLFVVIGHSFLYVIDTDMLHADDKIVNIGHYIERTSSTNSHIPSAASTWGLAARCQALVFPILC